jgi:hypothetical protein
VRAKAGQDRVGPANGELQRRRVGVHQVGGDDAHRLPGQLRRVPHDRRDVVAGSDRLPEELPADTAGRREDSEFHLSLLIPCNS